MLLVNYLFVIIYNFYPSEFSGMSFAGFLQPSIRVSVLLKGISGPADKVKHGSIFERGATKRCPRTEIKLNKFNVF